MQKKQKFPYLVGSKWTAVQKMWGWRHFQVVNRKNQGQFVFAEMVAACDPNVRFWLNAKVLKNRSQWQAGWQSLQEQLDQESQDVFSEVSEPRESVAPPFPHPAELLSEKRVTIPNALVGDADDFI